MVVRTLPQEWCSTLVEAKLGAIENVLSFHKWHWRFLVDPLGPAAKALHEGVPLDRLEDLLVHQLSHWPEDLSTSQPSPKRRTRDYRDFCCGGLLDASPWWLQCFSQGSLLRPEIDELSAGIHVLSLLDGCITPSGPHIGWLDA